MSPTVNFHFNVFKKPQDVHFMLEECTTAGDVATPQLPPRKVPEVFLVWAPI